MISVTLERFDANSEGALVVERHVATGIAVEKDQLLLSVETTKTLFEIYAEAAGIVVWNVEEGEDVKFGATLFWLCKDNAEAKSAEKERSKANTPETEVRATKRAEQLAAKHGIELTRLKKDGIVTERDVLSALESLQPARKTQKTSGKPLPSSRAVRVSGQRRVLLLGGGLRAYQVCDILSHHPQLSVAAIYDDDRELVGQSIGALSISHGVEAGLDAWKRGDFDEAIICIASIPARKRIFEAGKAFGGVFANAIDPTVAVKGHASIGEGNVLCAFVHLGTHAAIGNNNFIAAYSSVDHHGVVGDNCNFGPSVVLSGEVSVGDEVVFGTGIYVQPLVAIGARSLIASGSVIVSSVPADSAVKCKIETHVRPLKKS